MSAILAEVSTNVSQLSKYLFDDYISGKCNYIHDTNNHSFLSKEDEYILIELSQKGDRKAQALILKYNCRLVLKEVNRYKGKGIPFQDLEAEGNIGLLHAVNKFDLSSGLRLTTYATIWIQQYIERHIMNTSRLIRFPVHIVKNISKLNKHKKLLTEELNREPTLEELSSSSEFSDTHILELEELSKNSIAISNITYNSDSESNDMFDVISDHNDDIANLESSLSKSKTMDFLSCLNEQQKSVIILKYGLFDCEEKSFRDIGEQLNFTGERIRQINNKAIELLSEYANKNGLEFTDYFNLS